jgi:hypothetical protein
VKGSVIENFSGVGEQERFISLTQIGYISLPAECAISDFSLKSK